MARTPVLPEAAFVGALSAEAVWKLGEILQTIEQSKIFRDFFNSERFKASQKLTKQARVKTRRFSHALDPLLTFKGGPMNGR